MEMSPPLFGDRQAQQRRGKDTTKEWERSTVIKALSRLTRENVQGESRLLVNEEAARRALSIPLTHKIPIEICQRNLANAGRKLYSGLSLTLSGLHLRINAVLKVRSLGRGKAKEAVWIME